MKISISFLKTSSVIYLMMPVIILIGSWVKLSFAIPLLGLLLIAFYFFEKSALDDDFLLIAKPKLLLIALIVLVWMSFSGIGGMGIQLHDQLKTYMLQKDLSANTWPVTYHYKGIDYYLAAYFGYSLVPAALFGFLGYDITNLMTFWYVYFGVMLAIFWFLKLVGSLPLLAVVVFILFGGFDLAGYIFNQGFNKALLHFLSWEFGQIYWFNSLDINKFLLYNDNTFVLYTVPRHAVSAWLASGLFFYDFLVKKDVSNSPFYLFPLIFWSPMLLVGIFPFFLYSLQVSTIKRFFSFSNFLTIPIFLVLLSFVFAVSYQELDSGFIFKISEGIRANTHHAFHYFWFVFFEVLVWAIYLFLGSKATDWQQHKSIWMFTILVLLFIPFYKFGKYNDWVQRVSMPGLYLLMIFVVKIIARAINKPMKWLGIVLILLSSIDALQFMAQAVKIHKYPFNYNPPVAASLGSVPEISDAVGWPKEQMLAKGEPFFFKYLAKRK